MHATLRRYLALPLTLALVVLAAACHRPAATPADLPYSRATGWGQYLNPDKTTARVLPAPTISNFNYGPAGSTNPDTRVDLYIPGSPPVGPSGKRPLVIWFHGGGGTKSAAEIAMPIRELFDRGYVIASANFTQTYGPTPDAPILLAQAKRLVRLLKLSAAANGAASPWDPNRIYVSGISLGGYISSMIGLTPGLFEPTDADIASQTSSVAGVVGFQAPYDLPQMLTWANANYSTNPSSPTFFESNIVAGASNVLFRCRLAGQTPSATVPTDLCTTPAKVALIQQYSPKTYVASSNPATPFYLITASNDLVVQSVPQGQAFSDALTARNAAANVSDASGWVDITGGNHGYGLAIDTYVSTLPNAGQFRPGSALSSVAMLDLLVFLGCTPNTTNNTVGCMT